MALNPGLYRALQREFGEVRITDAGVPFTFEVRFNPRTNRREIFKLGSSEQYSVCCPFCGDTKFRLIINHRWLTTPVAGLPMITNFLFCQHEQCTQIYSPEFYRKFLDTEFSGLIGVLRTETAPLVETRMPVGCQPLDSLPDDHPVHSFLAAKYVGLTAKYLGSQYGACYTDTYDEVFKLAHNRIIFPVWSGGKLVGWDGRSLNPADKKRWVLSPSFNKVVYNLDRVPKNTLPIICEGIPAAIACGPSGVAIFGKTLAEHLCAEIGKRFPSAIVAVDPETFVPDTRTEKYNSRGELTRAGKEFAKELCEKLNKYCKIPVYPIVWPREILERAKQYVAGDKSIQVPDPADIGMIGMRQLLAEQVPHSHKGIVCQLY